MDTIIEIKVRSRVVQRQKFNSAVIRVGRAYDNDVIVSDQYVSPHHIVLSPQIDGGWMLENRSEVNSAMDMQGKPLETGHMLHSGDQIMIGKTTIQLYAVNHPVPEAIPIHQVDTYFNKVSSKRLLYAFPALLAFVVLSFIFTYLESGADLKTKDTVSAILVGVLIIFLWAAVWAALGRMVKHETRFFAHVFIATLFFIILGLYSELVDIIDYNLNSRLLADLLLYMGSAICFITLFSLSFYLALSWQGKTLKVSSVFATITILALIFLVSYDYTKFYRTPRYSSTLKSPLWLFTGSDSQARYLEKSRSVFLKAKKLIKKDED